MFLENFYKYPWPAYAKKRKIKETEDQLILLKQQMKNHSEKNHENHLKKISLFESSVCNIN